MRRKKDEEEKRKEKEKEALVLRGEKSPIRDKGLNIYHYFLFRVVEI